MFLLHIILIETVNANNDDMTRKETSTVRRRNKSKQVNGNEVPASNYDNQIVQ